ncbi:MULTISPECIES: ParB N-terminal domain-containing protein [Paenibacillus]|uniref:ParB N-terminal domain-containing protein n=1 Tax=Paenibacillus TaxID=44249 RepID=UPI00096C3864|nr:ParB N-terminal domain-containing protein [Paenibacillus odorifer]OMD87776.1 plasmid-partitioning protein [Paenibacillus odorifer]
MLIDISKIKVTDRIRQEFNDIEGLAQDIAENGLINPIVVTSDYTLIAGERRLRAHRHLGRTQVEVRVMEVRDYLHQRQLEYGENEHRSDFTWSERTRLGKELEQLKRLEAEERMKGNKENFPEHESGQIRDIVGEQIGVSGRQFDKMKFILENATPEVIQQLDDEVISTHKAFKETKERLESALREAEERAEQAEYEKEEIQRQHKDVVPAYQVQEAVSAALEQHDEEQTVYLKQKEKETEAQLKQRDDYWKDKMKDAVKSEELKVEQLKAGYQRTKEELEALKLQQPDDFDEQQAKLKLKSLQYNVDLNTTQFNIKVNKFLETAGLTALMIGSISSASSGEKKRLNESLNMLQTFIDQVRPAVNGRRAVE